MRENAMRWLVTLPLALLAGCGAFPQDRRGTETTCPVHGEALREGRVNVYPAKWSMPPAYLEASRKFPYAHWETFEEQPMGWPTQARVLYCPQCRAEETAWWRSRRSADAPVTSKPPGQDAADH
jgi:hypothetical protein